LKLLCLVMVNGRFLVAPCAGAWIETCYGRVRYFSPSCRPLRGGVD